MVNCAVESSNRRTSACLANHLHELGDTVCVDLVLLEVSQNTRNAVQRTFFINEFDTRGVTDDLLVLASTAVLGEDIDLCNGFPCPNGNVLYVP